MNNRDGTPMLQPVRHALATDKVGYVGEAVAAVIAETLAAGQGRGRGGRGRHRAAARGHRAERGRRRRRAANLRRRAAAMSGSISISATARRSPPPSRGGACHTARTAQQPNRRQPDRAARGAGRIRPGTRHLTLHVGCQGVFGFRNYIAGVLGVGRDKVRVMTDRVGGSFGMKQPNYVRVFLHPARGARTGPAGQMDRRPLRQLRLRHARARGAR